jgi:hypothetical protein
MYLRPEQITQQFSRKSNNPVNRVKADFARLSPYFEEIASLSIDQVYESGLSSSLDEVHNALKKLEMSCSALAAKNQNDIYTQTAKVEQYPSSKPDWKAIRKETRQANRLVTELSSALVKINTEVVDVSSGESIPQDILQKSRELLASICDLTAEAN